MRAPMLGNLIRKTWARVRWFLKEAVPLFILGTAILFVLDRVSLLPLIVRAAEPVMVGLLDLPAKTCVCELDSKTDIFKAKEILKDHMCIAGDVPAGLQAYGTPQEMEAYVKKLIDVVGKDTGFILSSGCTVPPDCKYDNFKTMIDTAKTYYPH